MSDHPGRKHKKRPRLPGTQPANPWRVGAVFNRLTVLAFIGTDGKGMLCRCRCECGGEVVVQHQNLMSGNTKACGCLHRRHGRADTPEHRVWRKMRERCSRPGVTGFHNYGGRGIRVCDRWQSFENFFADMGPRPSPGHTIERIDVNGDYAPDNCRWATAAEQNRNRRDNVRLTHDGQTRCVADWAASRGLSPMTIHSRLRQGWPVGLALDTPVTAGRRLRLSETERLAGDPTYRARQRTRAAVAHALRTGRLTRPAHCEHPGCGEGRTTPCPRHGHEREHRLDVVWLCRAHRRPPAES